MEKFEYEMNAKLQTKKNLLRKELAKRGILVREAMNAFDKYKYFSESQYKLLFTELFSTYGLELASSVVEVVEFTGTDKMPFGRRVTMSFRLHDIETGYNERSESVGEGTDKGDKSVYKAMTGALKYYFANTFNVATGDEPETGADDSKPQFVTMDDANIIKTTFGKFNKLDELLEKHGVTSVEKLTYEEGKKIVDDLRAKAKENKKSSVQQG